MDLVLFQFINNFAGRWQWLDILAIFFAKYFEYVLILCLLLFLLKNFQKYWAMVWQAFAVAIISRFVVAESIYYLFPRPRPFMAILEGMSVNLLFLHPDTPSFPSGHASFYFALSTVIYFYNKKTGILFFVASFLISVARVFAGLHWPSDILGGIVIGFLSTYFIMRLTSNKTHGLLFP